MLENIHKTTKTLTFISITGNYNECFLTTIELLFNKKVNAQTQKRIETKNKE